MDMGRDDDDDDNDLDDEIEVDDELGSSDLEILDDDLDLGSTADPDREPDDGERSSRWRCRWSPRVAGMIRGARWRG